MTRKKRKKKSRLRDDSQAAAFRLHGTDEKPPKGTPGIDPHEINSTWNDLCPEDSDCYYCKYAREKGIIYAGVAGGIYPAHIIAEAHRQLYPGRYDDNQTVYAYRNEALRAHRARIGHPLGKAYAAQSKPKQEESRPERPEPPANLGRALKKVKLRDLDEPEVIDALRVDAPRCYGQMNRIVEFDHTVCMACAYEFPCREDTFAILERGGRSKQTKQKFDLSREEELLRVARKFGVKRLTLPDGTICDLET